jgi:hypothetical protein
VRLAVAALIALLLPSLAGGATSAKVYLEDTIPSGSSSSVTFTTHQAASFRIRLRVPTAGSAKLFLLGKNAPKGINPLIKTSNTSGQSGACQGAAGSFYCTASYEPLPKGRYTWRVTWTSFIQDVPAMSAHVELTIRW